MQSSTDLTVKDGETSYQEEQEPTESPLPPDITIGGQVPIEEERVDGEQESVVESLPQQQTDFPDVEQAPVSRGLLTTSGAYSLLAMIQQVGDWRNLSEKIVQWEGVALPAE
jgi:hypothetical protein